MDKLAYFFRLFTPIVILLIVGAWLYGNEEINSIFSQVRIQDEARVRVKTEAMLSKLESLKGDLIFLSSNRTTLSVLNAPTPENIEALADDFIKFSASKFIYDQIRWIDEFGMEKVRVDFRQGVPVRIPDERLQDKSKRYFFVETIKLKPSEIFISPLDLNIENDQIQIPLKPMLRIARPVTNQQGKKRGIVILNYSGDDLLQVFSPSNRHTDNVNNMVVNSDGYWLKSDNATDEWGFMFNRPELNMAVRSPTAWKQIHSNNQGQLELDDGLWTWETIYPVNRYNKAPFVNVQTSNNYFWKIISLHSTDKLATIRLVIWLKVVGITALFLILYGFGSWKLADIWNLQRNLKEKYKTVANFAYDWETWIDPAGQYLYCSPSCIRMTGYSQEKFLTNPRFLTEIVHIDDVIHVDTHFKLHHDAENVCQLEFRIVRLDGEIRWLEHVCQPVFNSQNVYLGRRASNRDISERKLLEQELQQLVDQERCWRIEQSQFMAMLAHELKTPLSVIRMVLGSKKPCEETLLHANRAVSDMNNVIERCLQSEKITDQKLTYHVNDCDVLDLLTQLHADIHPLEKLIIHAQSVPLLHTDTQLLHTILFNLIDNALKYSPPESVVHIEVQSENDGVLVSIKNRIGIAGSPDTEKVFQKYYRNKAAHHRTGSGLGLYLVKSMTTLLGGHVLYHCDDMHVVFTLWIPINN